MPRTPVAAAARLDRISVRATAGEVAALDRLRGSSSRSDYIRSLLRDAAHTAVVAGLHAKDFT